MVCGHRSMLYYRWVWVLKVSIFLLFSQLHISMGNEIQDFLQPFKISHLSNVVGHTFCPEKSGTYMVGARARLSNFLNQTKKIVTALEIMCSDGIRIRLPGNETLILEKNIGNWTEMKECPNGLFATDIIFNLEYVGSLGLIAYSRNEQLFSTYDRQAHYHTAGVDVRSVLKDKFIAGVTFNCTYLRNSRKFVPIFDEHENGNGGGGDKKPEMGDSFTVGQTTGYGLRIYCLRNRVITGIFVNKQQLISPFDGERMIPLKMTVKCEEIYNPARNCNPELGWKQIEFDHLDCVNLITGNHLSSNLITAADGYPPNISCNVKHSVGSVLNRKITNLKRILAAYMPTKMGESVGLITIPKLLSPSFRSDWVQKYKLNSIDYDKLVHENTFDRYLKLRENQMKTVQFRNLMYDRWEKSNVAKSIVRGDEVKHELVIKQLVGYCSVYKIYFPLFKNEVENFVRRDIDGIQRDILFE